MAFHASPFLIEEIRTWRRSPIYRGTDIYGASPVPATGHAVSPHPGAMMSFNDQSWLCHAERSEASLCPSRETLRGAQGDTI